VTTGDFKQTIVSPPGALDRSPCGTGTCARLVTEFVKGRLGLREPRRFEGVLGTCFTGEVTAVEARHGVTYVIPRIQGRAYLTGFHQFVVEPEDPLPEGYRIGWRTWRPDPQPG
jgi:proline racemase